ncbi:MAG: DUF5615 family PIN-like protein [Sphaerospermopsis kisseleviana]
MWQYAKERKLVIVTKDADFSDRMMVDLLPPKVSCYTAKLYNPNILNSCGTGILPVTLIQIKCTTAYWCNISRMLLIIFRYWPMIPSRFLSRYLPLVLCPLVR